MIAGLYRRVVPEKLRKRIYSAFLGGLLTIIRNPKLLKYLMGGVFYSIVTPKTDKEKAIKEWSKVWMKPWSTPYPYLWTKEYDRMPVVVSTAPENSLSFVMHHGKRLYFHREVDNICTSYESLLIEQDERSAHRYVDSYAELTDKVLLDVGGAEAIFTLDTIEYVRHAFIFECDERWIEALNATFAPWKDKVTIVRKYVSDTDDDDNVTLDTFFKDKPTDNIFLKMDIEGYERKALKGAKGLLKNGKNISGSVCIYHLPDDGTVIPALLSEAGNISMKVVPGYLIFGGEFRSAILRFTREG